MSKPIQCPKCKAFSGDDWTQCGNNCPMPMSPFFKALTKNMKPRKKEDNIILVGSPKLKPNEALVINKGIIPFIIVPKQTYQRKTYFFANDTNQTQYVKINNLGEPEIVKCPVVEQYQSRQATQEFAIYYLKQYAEANNLSIDRAAAELINTPYIDKSVRNHILRLMEDKQF